MEMPVEDICTGIPCSSGSEYYRGSSITPLHLHHDFLRRCEGRIIFLSVWDPCHSRVQRQNISSERDLKYLQVHLPPINIDGTRRGRKENNAMHCHPDYN